MKIGDPVTFIDSFRREHQALVTNLWPYGDDKENPSVNVVYVSGDTTKEDSYGRQLERATSVTHESRQPRHPEGGPIGMCWK